MGKKTSHCTGSDLEKRGPMSLPVLREHGPRGTIRRSRSGRRRAVVLAVVQGLIIAHIVFWLLSRRLGWFGGYTTTPIEPSEAMQFVKEGVVNAGLVFFAVALLATLVLGRWFCGWGCHLVMLQDLCGWIMRKAGVRPKAFRSRLLIYVPLVLALYMFVWPAFYRFAVAPFTRPDLEWPGFSTHFTTTDFWQTFPGVLVMIPFLLICGFAAVYFLGAKGFCTYGCPYGGFFAPLDEFAPGRIRVTDACEHCGHCTAVCTSNVRVHEEVREYGMVVDPGCMKCLDCVSVCPNDALYFGFGRPAHAKGPARNKAPKRVYDLSWPEELGFTVFFAAVFFAVRGVYGLIPMLMAAGIAGIVTFLAWKLWRLGRDPDVRLHRFQLRRGAKMGRAGWMYTAAVAVVLALCLHSGLVNAAEGLGLLHYRKVEPDAGGSLAPDADRHAEQAARYFGIAANVTEGGIGLASNRRLDLRRARVARLRGQSDQALALYQRVLSGHGDDVHLVEEVVLWLRAQGRLDDGIELCRELRADLPDDVRLLRWESLLLNDSGRLDEAIDVCRMLAALEPDNPVAHASLAYALAQRGDREEALAAARRALELDPQDPSVTTRVRALLNTLEPATGNR